MQSSGLYSQNGDIILGFDSYIENNYHNSNGIAFEPIEDGSFSNDSKQNTPFIVALTVVFVIKDPKDKTNVNKTTIDNITNILENLTTGVTLYHLYLAPFGKPTQNYWQYGKYYQNVCLTSFDYQNTSEQLELVANLIFQQVRLTNTEYSNVQNTANPENSYLQNNGQVQPYSDPSILFNSFSLVPLPFGGG